jgi:two-component system, NtrC family, sensor kinase
VNVLARLSIRTKIRVALVLLAAICSVLALSGVRGSVAYRSAAHSIGDRAEELPRLIALTRQVQSLRDDFSKVQLEVIQLTDRGTFSSTKTFLELAVRTFTERLKATPLVLKEYRDLVARRDASDPLAGSNEAELALLDDMAAKLEAVAKQLPEDRDGYGRLETIDSLEKQINELSGAANRLPDVMQQRMAAFRDEVRASYRLWIGMAYTGAAAAILLVIVLAAGSHRLVVRPFNQLIDGCRKIAGGDYHHRISVLTQDELSELARVLNTTTERFQQRTAELNTLINDLDRQVQDRTREVVRSEQLASVGFLAAGVAHEINNPLGAIAWSAESLESRMHDVLHGLATTTKGLDADQIECLKTNLNRIQREAFRCKGITERLLDFSRLGSSEKEATELRELVEDVVEMVRTLGQYRRNDIRVTGVGSLYAHVNPQEIRQVVLNLVTNALESLGEEGWIELRLWQVDDRACLTVEDNGCGMTGETLKHLFEPFYTRRRDGRGTGLGLSITYRIVQEHGGTITAHSEGPNRGSRMELRVPRTMEQKGTHVIANAA